MNNVEVLQKSPLALPFALDLMPPETVIEWGKTLIVAPHPDDESLGCGGAIALLREAKMEVCALVMSDGTLSHPNSRRFPAEKLRALREREMRNALEILGVSSDAVTFFRYRDRSVPQNETAKNWAEAVERCRAYLQKIQPQTILVPWRRDPHPDHRATCALINAARNKPENRGLRLIEYPIWLWEIAKRADAPCFGEVCAWRLDIETVFEKKQRAVAAHESQVTNLIDDDPQGFRLTPEILAHFAQKWEIYLESV